MQTPRSLWLVLGLAALALSAGCGSTAEPGAGEGGSTDPAALNGTWVPTSFAVTDSLMPDPAVGSELTLMDGQATGSGGVNRFTADYEAADDGTMSFGPIASTRMAGPDDAMAQEAKLFSSLADVAGFEVADGVLVLSDASDATVMVLAPR